MRSVFALALLVSLAACYSSVPPLAGSWTGNSDYRKAEPLHSPNDFDYGWVKYGDLYGFQY
jgi:hypothetical protein